jgi:hypothetical protein
VGVGLNDNVSTSTPVSKSSIAFAIKVLTDVKKKMQDKRGGYNQPGGEWEVGRYAGLSKAIALLDEAMEELQDELPSQDGK